MVIASSHRFVILKAYIVTVRKPCFKLAPGILYAKAVFGPTSEHF
jgi:hypothetical protein